MATSKHHNKYPATQYNDATESYEQPTETERIQQQQETYTNRQNMTYSNMTTKNDFYRGNLTISADIQHIRTFNTEQFYLYLSAKQPKAWQHVQGLQAVNAKFVEMCLDNPHAMHHILTNGIDTHAQHLNFTPDEPLVTTVSFWNVPIQMTYDQAN